jgi:hypothetical protein
MWGNTVAIHSVLKKKTMKLNSQPAQYEKNKIDKDNSGKKTKTIIKKQKKTIWGNTVAIHNILKKKNYKAKFSTSFILKK